MLPARSPRCLIHVCHPAQAQRFCRDARAQRMLALKIATRVLRPVRVLWPAAKTMR
jgi:hypothetical protein